MRNVHFHFDAEQCRPVLRQWCLNPNRHEGGHFYLLYISIFSLILMCLPRGVMDKAANSGSVDPWFDPCLMLSFFHSLFLSCSEHFMISCRQEMEMEMGMEMEMEMEMRSAMECKTAHRVRSCKS